MRTLLASILAGALVLAATPAHARIKLTTLPERESVRVDIQNGRYTLVEEERTSTAGRPEHGSISPGRTSTSTRNSIVFPRHQGRRRGERAQYELPAQRERSLLDDQCRKGRAGRSPHLRISSLTWRPNRATKASSENDETKLLMQVYMTVTNTRARSFRRDDRAAGRRQDHGPLLQRRRAEADAGRQVRRSAHRQAVRVRR